MARQFLLADRITFLALTLPLAGWHLRVGLLALLKHGYGILTSTLLRLLNTAQLVVLAYTVYFWLITCRIPPNYLLLGTLKRCERSPLPFLASPHNHHRSLVPSYLTVSNRLSAPIIMD